jgi:hypothetical protein
MDLTAFLQAVEDRRNSDPVQNRTSILRSSSPEHSHFTGYYAALTYVAYVGRPGNVSHLGRDSSVGIETG